jgi:nicotinate phosphoribosyltransferase
MQSQSASSAPNVVADTQRQTKFDWLNPLFTDLYQITMAYGEWKAKRAEEPAVFEAFFRKAPFKGCFTIFGGLDEVLLFL